MTLCHPDLDAVLGQLNDVRERERRMRAIERSLAYGHAVDFITTECVEVEGGDLVEAFDLATVALSDEDEIQESVDYLEWRGLLQRSELNPLHVAILDESEATQ